MTKMGRRKLTEEDLTVDDVYPAPSLRTATMLASQGFPVALRDVATDYDTTIPVNRAWRDRISETAKLQLEELENVFYACGEYGAAFNDVCNYFGIEPTNARNIECLRDVHSKGISALRNKLRYTQIKEALEKKNPLMLIWVSKNFGGMGDDGQTQINIDADGGGSLGLFSNVVQVQAQRDEFGKTIGEEKRTSLDFNNGQDPSTTAE